ncbi:MAG: DUF5343 domain-containing protein [Pseudonocardiales bacterium]|nr:DUF5343 domain-containing protein [Pseudonocardiales bacterium]
MDGNVQREFLECLDDHPVPLDATRRPCYRVTSAYSGAVHVTGEVPMVMKASGPAAYGPGKTIIGLIERSRGPGLPSPLTVESLRRVSVSESLAPRTLHSLKLLDLVDEQGKPTRRFEDLRRAPAAQFKAELIDLLKSVYADVFEVVEPANATYEDVQDAFRSFTPQGQRDRMVSLFLSLLEYAEYSSLPSVRSSGGVRSAGGSPTPPQTNRHGKTAPRVPPASSETPPAPSPPLQSSSADSGYSAEVRLGKAGTVTLHVDVNPLLLSKADRDFFYNLVDSIREYESAQTSPTVNGVVNETDSGGGTS